MGIEVAGALAPAPPSLAEMALSFEAAMKRWKAAGFPVVSQADYRERATVCEGCKNWRPGIFAGCRLCRCSKLKLWLGTEGCRLGKW